MTYLLLPTCLVACVTFGLAFESTPSTPPAPAARPGAERTDAAAPPGNLVGVCGIAIEGTKQGMFKSEVARKGADRMTGLRVAYEVTLPRDVATGQASGKRQHQPLTFVKEVGAASPQIFNACVTLEALRTVTFDFEKPAASGEDVVYYTIKLTNALVVDVKYMTEEGRQLEAVTLTFQKIDMSSTAGKTAGGDDWAAKG